MDVKATVKYQYGPYKGIITIYADENDDNETIIARAKAQLRRGGWLTLPMAYESFTVAGREPDNG